MEKVDKLLKEHNNFIGAQIRSIEFIDATTKMLTLVEQDDDGEDVSSVKIIFSGIQSSRILEQNVLSFLDMLSGVTLIKENDLYGFALGKGTAMLHVHNSPLHIVASGIEIQ